MATERVVNVALIGGGMFGGDVVLRTIEDLERCGVAPYLGRVGLDVRARDMADVRFRLVAIGTRTEPSATRLCSEYREKIPTSSPSPYFGTEPWREVFRDHSIDILFVATPDALHAAPTKFALENGAHVMVEKPLTLRTSETDEIIDLAQSRGLIVGVDMHKRYDPCHRFLFEELVPQIGKPLYARAVLEEPLEVSTQTFAWAASSNPFSYVGCHWVDLFTAYLGDDPISVHAVGQKDLLKNWPDHGGESSIDTFDAMQVSVDYASGLRVYYVNNWINPDEFEAPVNQEMEIVGTRGKIEFDQQDRGLRATIHGVGSRTFNPHFTSDIQRAATSGQADLPPAYDGYGKDSIVVIVERALEVLLGYATREELAGTYPDAESSRSTVQVLEAAEAVAELNLTRQASGNGTPVTAALKPGGAFRIVDPLAS